MQKVSLYRPGHALTDFGRGTLEREKQWGRRMPCQGGCAMMDADLKVMRQAALEATPGPWANTDTVKEMLGYEPMDWWYVYAKRSDNDKLADTKLPILVCKMAGNRATEAECAKARFEQFSENKPCSDPGQAGKDARFIATWNPQACLDLLQDMEITECALADADRETKRLWDFVCEIGKMLGLHECQREHGCWPTLNAIRAELERTLEDAFYVGQTAYSLGYNDGQRDGQKSGGNDGK